ncbi:MAG TPA: hypothetical protein P5191_13510 [Ruminococcus sp.]|nr:hypothetical protein [Ruminococcus sp.]
MKRAITCFTAAVLAVSMLPGCGKKKDESDLRPLMGLSWFEGYDSVKTELEAETLIREREDNGEIRQKMLDYADISLFDANCDLTLCFTDNGLVGLNYHDIHRNKSYRNWYNTLEDKYGSPTESGKGMASWYDNPLGKDTVIYLFNLQEGVQVSFYASADAPDKSYEKERKPYIPTPEIRTPVVPVSYEEEQEDGEAVQEVPEVIPPEEKMTVRAADVQKEDDLYTPEEDIPEDNELPEPEPSADTEPDEKTTVAGTTAIHAVTAAQTTHTTTRKAVSSTTTAVTTAAPVRTEPQTQPDKSKDFLINGLKFYGSADSERKKMSKYTQIYEYKTEEPGQPWEIVMEYENVRYLGKKCDAVLCFTSLGLVGINYFDPGTGNYSYWKKQFVNIYGTPDEVQYDYAAWTNDPAGKGTEIYIFALDDGVQISFFADDTGSEIS